MADVGGPLVGGSGDDLVMGDARQLSAGIDNYSNSGSFALKGNGGNDILVGDLYIPNGDTEGDELRGGDGDDRLYGDTAPDLTAFGFTTIWDGDPNWDKRATGSADKLYGEGGNDIIYGGSGLDTLSGGTGDDQLFGQNDADILEGGDGLDRIYCGKGDDTASGGAESDEIYGNAGDDRINGGLFQDKLTGGDGKDDFVYETVKDSTVARTDVIADFDENATDRIDLSAIDAVPGGADNRFQLVGEGNFTAAGQVQVLKSNGSMLVRVNVDADRSPEMVIKILGVHTLDLADFIL